MIKDTKNKDESKTDPNACSIDGKGDCPACAKSLMFLVVFFILAPIVLFVVKNREALLSFFE